MSGFCVKSYLRAVDSALPKNERKMGVYVYQRIQIKLLESEEDGLELFDVQQYAKIISSSLFSRVMAVVGNFFAILDVFMDWISIVHYYSIATAPTIIAAALLVIGYFFNVAYLAVVRQVTLNFQSVYMPHQQSSQPPNRILKLLDRLIQNLASCWNFLLCKSRKDSRPSPEPQNQTNEREEMTNSGGEIAEDTNSSSEIANGNSSGHIVVDVEEMETPATSNNPPPDHIIPNAFINVNSAHVLAVGILSAFLAPSIFMNTYCLIYMISVNRCLDRIGKRATVDHDTVLDLHCRAFLLFGLNYITKECNNIELLTETLLQLSLQFYIVLQEPFNSPLDFNESLHIPWWRYGAFLLAFLAIGNAMRSAVLGKWEYYYYEHAEDEDDEKLLQCFQYPILSHLLSIVGHGCVLGMTALLFALYFLYSPFLASTCLVSLLLVPTLTFLQRGPGDDQETWANRYMWFFTKIFSSLDTFNPNWRDSLRRVAARNTFRVILYGIAFQIMYFLRPDLFLFCGISFLTVAFGYSCLCFERYYTGP